MSSSLINPTTVYHIASGATVMHGVDAHSAVANSPREWSLEPWTREVVARVEVNIKRNAELNRVPIVGALEPEESR